MPWAMLNGDTRQVGWGVGEKKSNSRGRKINTHVDDREKMKDIF